MWLVFQGIVTRRSNFRNFGEEGTPYYTPRMMSDEEIEKIVNKSAPKHEPPPNPETEPREKTEGMNKYETIRMRIITEPRRRQVKMDVSC